MEAYCIGIFLASWLVNSKLRKGLTYVLFEHRHYVNSCFSVPHHCVNQCKVLNLQKRTQITSLIYRGNERNC